MNIGLWTQNNIGPDFGVPKKYDAGNIVFLTYDDDIYEGIEKFINSSIEFDFFNKDRAFVEFDIIIDNHEFGINKEDVLPDTISQGQNLLTVLILTMFLANGAVWWK